MRTQRHRLPASALALLMAACGPAPEPGETAALHQAALITNRSVSSLDVLVVIYTDNMTAAEIARAKQAFALGREFYWRNSLARLNLNLTFMEIPTRPPDVNVSMVPIEADLRNRGVTDNQYSAIVATENDPYDGRGLDGNWGGFVLFGQTAGAYFPIFGGFYEIVDPAWTFIHEFQHALDGVIANGSGFPQMLHGHPYEGGEYFFNQDLYPGGVDYGTHFDWEAGTLRLFQHHDDLAAPWNRPITVVDSDGDGLPDADSRVAMDEARLGTSPTSADTDGDGLDDLAEYTAGTMRGADPLRTDTDGDGRVDGADAYPLDVAAPELQFGGPGAITLDGLVNESAWQLIERGLRYGNHPDDAQQPSVLLASWDSNFLYLAVESTRRAGYVDIQIDGSGRSGPWVGRDFFYLKADLVNQRLITRQYLQGRAGEFHPEGWGPNDIPPQTVPGSSVVVRDNGDLITAEIAIPRTLGYGFGTEINMIGATPKRGIDLAGGTTLGLQVRLSRIGSTPNYEEDDVLPGEWASFMELLQFLDLTLVAPGPARLEHATAFPQDVINTLHPMFRLYNTSSGSLALSRFEVRYWFKREGSASQSNVVDWAGRMPAGTTVTSSVSSSVVSTSRGGQTHYLRTRFGSGAGSLQPGQFVEVHSRVWKQGFSDYTQSNDHSFVPTAAFAASTRMTVYLDGQLVWGQEP